MKNILLTFLLLPSLCATAKDKKDKPEPAFKKGTITATAAYGYIPSSKSARNWYKSDNIFQLLADYQVSRNFNVSAKYIYYNQVSKTHHYKTFTGAPMQYRSRYQANFIAFTANYCYLNRGRVSLSSGLGLGFGNSRDQSDIIDSNGKPLIRRFSQRNGALDIRLLEARVKLKKNFALYGSLGYGHLGMIALGASYNFPAYAPPAKKSKRDKPEPAFSKGAVSLIATYGTLSIFANEFNSYTKYPGNFGLDAQYQLSPKFNVGLHYGYVHWIEYTTTYFQNSGIPPVIAGHAEKTKYVHDLMATGSYTYLNNGRLSLGVGLALGYGIHTFDIKLTDTNGYVFSQKGLSDDNKVVCDIRFVEAKVNLGSGFGLYGCVGTRSAIAAGLQYTFNNHKEY